MERIELPPTKAACRPRAGEVGTATSIPKARHLDGDVFTKLEHVTRH
jgi:hypothetical protein